jgi:group I intron endonuclease
MKKLTYNNSIFLFLDINDMSNLKKNDLKKIKEDYLLSYQNCIIYNYFDLKNYKNIIRDIINKAKHLNQIKLNFEKCKFSTIDETQKNLFLKTNHIQGIDNSQIFYGTFYNNELISIMTFIDKQKYNKNTKENEREYELSRFSTKLGYITSGIFKKMLDLFIKVYHPKKITTIVDYDIFNKKNNIYINNKFKLDKIFQPNYKFLLKTNNQLYDKSTYINEFFRNELISKNEKELIKKNTINVWNCGRLKYIARFNDNDEIIYGYIYLIRNLVNNKVCVGQTDRTLSKRKLEYYNKYTKNDFYNPHLLNAFNKYGWNNFTFTEIDIALNVDELNEKEIFYIKKYKSNDRNFGYNIESGGKNSSPTDETLLKMSKAHLGIVQSEEWKNSRIAKAGSEEAKKYGKVKTEEEKKYLSEFSPKFWQGKTRDEETRKKISETKLNKGLSDKQKDVICKKVYKINYQTKEIVSIFESSEKASKFENVNQSTISRWCSATKIVNGYIWSFKPIKDLDFSKIVIKEVPKVLIKEKEPYIVSEETRKKLSEARKNIKQSQEWIDKRIDVVAKPVIKLDKTKNIILEKFRSLADAGRYNKDNLSYEAINRLCLGYSKNDENIIWCYEEDYLNKTIPTHQKTIVREFSELSQNELDNIVLKYKNNETSMRQLSEEFSVNFSTLNKYLKDLDKPKSIFNEGIEYVAVCKKTNKRFVDYLNKSGTITTHISETYPEFKIESKFKRKSVEEKTGKPWYYEFFEFIKK